MSEVPTGFELSNDYDPSMRFLTAFLLTKNQGTESTTLAYYEIQPTRHTGLHSDNAEEIIYVADGEGEIFISGRSEMLGPGASIVVKSGVGHDIWAHGEGPLRLLSFFATNELETTFNEKVLPLNENKITPEIGAQLSAGQVPPAQSAEPEEPEMPEMDEPAEEQESGILGLLMGGDAPPPPDESAAEGEEDER